jgi:secreted trypsin-like serine protease
MQDLSMLILTYFLSIIGIHANGDRPSVRIKAQYVPKKVSRIIGGENAPDGRYTFAQISLQLPKSSNDDDAHECGGSLIAPDMILTAGHCKAWFSTANLDRYDFDDPSDNYWKIDSEKLEVHPMYEASTFRYDFAVVKLKAVLPDAIPVVLNRNASFPFEGDRLTVLGWGTTNLAPYAYPDTLQVANVFSISNDACRNTLIANQALYKNEIFDEMMCAQRPGVDACAGDSGGPLIVEGSAEGLDVQVGIVSWGRGCAIYPG